MRKSLEDRELKVDLNALPKEEVDRISLQFAKFVSDTINEAVGKIKKASAVYGTEFHLLWELTAKGELPMWQKPLWYEQMNQNLNPIKSKKKAVKKAVKKTSTKKKSPKE